METALKEKEEVRVMGDVFNFLFGSATAIWFWMAIILTVVEIETMGLISVWFVFGSIVAGIASIFISSVLIQAIIFIAVSALLMILLRQMAVNSFRNKTVRKNNIEELADLPCQIVKEVVGSNYGEIKLQGKIWRCLSESKRNYQEGDEPNVLRVEGNTIILE